MSREIVPAATVVILRDRPEGPPELLMVERAQGMSFAGGALVFPGGRIDPADRALAELLDDRFEDAAARIAAVREAIEEAGIAIGVDPAPDPARLEAIRDGLHQEKPLGEVLHQAGIALALDRLVPFARWCPDHYRRVFDTHFYLAAAPEEAVRASADGGESVRLFWSTARDVLAEADAGRATIIFPTRRNLERLASFGSFAEAVAHARAHPIRTVTPWIERRGEVDHLCIPEGIGYPVTSEPLSTATRA